MADELTMEQMVKFAELKEAAVVRGESRFQFHGRWWVLGANGEISYSYPEPEGQTHQAIDNMRELLPSLVRLLQTPFAQNGLMIEGKKINWDVINDMERQCGLPQTPCPDSVATQRLGLKK